jgi:hypothetical protein
VGIFRSSRSFSGSSSFFFIFRTDVVFLNPFGDFPSAINSVKPNLGGAAAAARRRHGLEVEDEELLKDRVVIFISLGVLLYCSMFLLMAVSYSQKKKL